MRDPNGPERALVFCPPCESSHLAEVRIDADGFPLTEWLEPHTRTETTEIRRGDAVEAIADAAGQALDIALDAVNALPVVDGIVEQALAVNDSLPQPARLDDEDGER
jgi:hypothetical protein